ncbi:hypothetical protein PtA15_10A309 [Puccinia triticina]|uniref:Cytochrome P450 n=1 Tax=Puccinia triticina TaxID=208348 RepID=A0ABY7CX13_9BASI|nr:uncharacterized protein PtA15_10A309 [Puccinia triticina]WAQ88888.1 hypothetical protein PtA15_10A309 [Puccinia triticina]WAR58945.1 hypothetical protein PtB15_10B285 [Puccinia triticina]
MLSSNMITFIYQNSVHVYDHFLTQRDHLPESDAILNLFDLLIIYFYVILTLRCITIYFSILSPDSSWLILNTFSITHSFLNTVQNFVQGSDFLLELPMSSSSETELKSDPAVTSKFRLFIRYLNFKPEAVSLEKIQKCLHLIYRKFSSILRPQILFAKAQRFVAKKTRQKALLCLAESADIGSSFKAAHASTTDIWKCSPRIWTWPWLGSLCSYTRDPLGFIQRQHQSQGDVFTTTILGYNCTFIQSNDYIQSFTTATRKVLDVTAAYKLIAAPLIGEEAFFGQTKYMHQVVLSRSRTEQLHQRLWELAEELLEIKWAQCVSSGDQSAVGNWRKIDLGQMLDYVIFGLDVFFLIGEQMVNVNLDRISHLFRVMDSDLSLLGILLPMIRGGRCPRKEAKNELLGFLKRDVQRRIERRVQHAVHAAFGPSDCAEIWPDGPVEDSQELPEILLRSELKELDEAILLDYHRGESSAIKAIDEKVEFIALFIYGFVWAAQTNSAAATIGLVHDILLHDQSQALCEPRPCLSHADKIRRECTFALLKDNSCPAPFLEDMPHLAHCLNETLRLRATGAWVRLADKSFHLTPQGNQSPGIICPPGFIVLSPMPISLNPSTYPNPNQWDPHRYDRAPFISSSSAACRDASRHIPIDKKYLIPPTTPSSPYFASWGLGRGHCPGKHLAYKMISMTVARFFNKFEVRPLKDCFENANFEDVAVAGVQRLKNDFTVLIRKRF